jgi:hypothetical protein
MLSTWRGATGGRLPWSMVVLWTLAFCLPSTLRAQDRAGTAAGTQSGTSSIKVETGAPRPPAQTPGITPALPPVNAPPPPPTIKVGGALILAGFFPFGLEKESRNLGIPTREHAFEVFRASVLLDSKIDRFGVHIDFRFRDKRARGYWTAGGTAWLDEIYGSVDLIRPESAWGPLVLKVGKTYKQFGIYWDNTFVGNVMLRDGIKIDPNYGVSLEGVIGARNRVGAKYFAQYYVIDGGPNTSIDARDTISNPAPLSGYPDNLGRRRNIIVGRVEPFVAITPVITLKVGASIENFTADFGPTMDQRDVKRFGGDFSFNLAWFGVLGEYVVQKGAHTLIHPFAPAGPIQPNDFYERPPRATGLPARYSEDIRYMVLGARFSYKFFTLRYNWSRAQYLNIPFPYADLPATVAAPSVDVQEIIQVPGATFTITPQLFLMVEYLRQTRNISAPVRSGFRGLPETLVNSFVAIGERDLLLDNQVVVTLHGRM